MCILIIYKHMFNIFIMVQLIINLLQKYIFLHIYFVIYLFYWYYSCIIFMRYDKFNDKINNQLEQFPKGTK